MSEQTATVKVFEPCACGPCARGERWFWCERPALVAEYACDPRYDEPSVASVEWIKAQHPGCPLVFIRV